MAYPAAPSTIDTYGGALNDALPVEDPTTDRSAAGANQAFADCAAMTNTAPIAWCRFTTSATTPTLLSSGSAWGNDPSVRPTVTRLGTGVFQVTWPASVTDALGATVIVNIHRMTAQPEGSLLIAVPALGGANAVNVTVYNTSFLAADLAGSVIHVTVG